MSRDYQDLVQEQRAYEITLAELERARHDDEGLVARGLGGRAMDDLLVLLDAETEKAQHARKEASQAQQALQTALKQLKAKGDQLNEANLVSAKLGELLQELQQRFVAFGSDSSRQEAVAAVEARAQQAITKLEQTNQLLRQQLEGQERALEANDAHTGKRIAMAEEAMVDHEKHRRSAIAELEATKRKVSELRIELEQVKAQRDQSDARARRLQRDATAMVEASEMHELAAASSDIARNNAATSWWQSRCARAWDDTTARAAT